MQLRSGYKVDPTSASSHPPPIRWCHQHRKLAEDVRACDTSGCPNYYCFKCLKNIYDLEKDDLPEQWACFRCQKSCKCSICSPIEDIQFTSEGIKELLDEEFGEERFNSKKEQDKWMTKHIGKLKSCLKDVSNKHLEKTQDSLKQEVARGDANEKLKTLADMFKILKEYNNSLQQHNIKLLRKLEAESDVKEEVEKEMAAILEIQRTLKDHDNMLEEEFTSAINCPDDTIEEIEARKREADILRGELQQESKNSERLLSLRLDLTTELNTLKEVDSLARKITSLEDYSSSLRRQISELQHKLATTTEKRKMDDMSLSELSKEFEEAKRMEPVLQGRLLDAKTRAQEDQNLRQKLENEILELQSRRALPPRPDDGAGPASVKSAARGYKSVLKKRQM